MPVPNPTIQQGHCQFTYKILTFYLEQLLRNLLRKITVLIALRERQYSKYKEEQTGQSQLSIPRYNLLLLFCIPNMNFLSYVVAEISLTKNVERKKKGHIQERINRRMPPVLNTTIQLFVVYQYTKYDFILNGSGDIFDEKVLRNYGRTNGRTDVNQYTRGYQKVLSLTWKEPEIWIYSALFFNVVPFQLHTLVPSSFPVINTRSVEVNILVP